MCFAINNDFVGIVFFCNKNSSKFYVLSKVPLLHTLFFRKILPMYIIIFFCLTDHSHSVHSCHDFENVKIIRYIVKTSHNSTLQERSVLPKYPRISPVIRSSPTSSGSTLDCSSNITLVTNTSPFNSQTALITEKKYFSSDGKKSNHYYAENLKNNHQKTLNRSRIYDPLNKNQDVDYKQLDPLLPSEQNSSINILMDSQDMKMPKDSQEPIQLPSSEFQKESKSSWIRYAAQVSFHIFFYGYMESTLILTFSSNLKSITFKNEQTDLSLFIN